MTNNTKKLLITTIFLAVLLLSSVYAALLPSVHAAKRSRKNAIIIPFSFFRTESVSPKSVLEGGLV
jgi:hypothetical protein